MENLCRFKFSILLLGVLLIINHNVFAQTDTAFWFGAPDVLKFRSTGRDGNRPIVLILTAYNQTAQVTVSQPAGGVNVMPNQHITVPAHSMKWVDITDWIDHIETQPANTVVNNGLELTSDYPIDASYMVVTYLQGGVVGPPNKRSNPEIFGLRGQKALGHSFYIPFQNKYANKNAQYDNGFIIVATEDKTAVTINPSNDIIGHAAGVPFTIRMNKGQTYSAISTGIAGSQHLNGSKVTANHPIAITLLDDDLHLLQGADLAGDQIISEDNLGTEYIAVNGMLFDRTPRPLPPPGTYGDDLFVNAVADNTSISVNGNQRTTIDAGEIYRIDMQGIEACY